MDTRTEHNLCVLIDFENIAAGVEKEGLGRFDIGAVFRRLKDKGRILVARSYGDWGRFAKFKQPLLEQGVTMVELTSYRGAEKNRADIALVVDAMELAFTRHHLDTFVLLSGDSDFTPLVMRLREFNKRVVGIGTRGSTSRLLVAACDEFIFYDSLTTPRQPTTRDEQPPQEAAEEATALSPEEAFSLLVETVEGLQKDDPEPVLAGLVKQSMKRKEPAFDEGDYGYSGFARFLEAARAKGLVRIARDERAGGYRVDLPNGDSTASDPDEEPPSPAADKGGDDGDDALAQLDAQDQEAGRLARRLADAGFHPLTELMRHTVVHEFVDHVNDRQQRNKRNTLVYCVGDVARRCRKTDPVVPTRHVKAVIHTLRAAGQLLHADGNPVRSANAHFTIRGDAEDLLAVLRRFYVEHLVQLRERLDNLEALSTLLWGDTHHTGPARELLAEVTRAAGEQARAPSAAQATEEPEPDPQEPAAHSDQSEARAEQTEARTEPTEPSSTETRPGTSAEARPEPPASPPSPPEAHPPPTEAGDGQG